jgi:tetratricopeptide (TPR) repeat protein
LIAIGLRYISDCFAIDFNRFPVSLGGTITILRIEPLTMLSGSLGEENPLPYFRSEQTDQPFNALPSIPPEECELAGWQTGYRVLPYRMQDQYTRERQLRTWSTMVLENNLLKATFQPALGGRLLSLYYKPLERELLYRNPVFQPANLALRNAWFSGGIEWNVGQYGHALNNCSPVFVAEIRDATGEPGLRLYDFDRCKGFFWQIDFYLPQDSSFLQAHCRVINPATEERPLYWWTNIAVAETSDLRVLSPVQRVIYVDLGYENHSYGETNLPILPTTEGKDGSYPTNFSFASEYFFQCDGEEMPWEAALDGQGKGLIEASSAQFKYRKMFCWGMHQGGRHWQEFLSIPNSTYLEIQSGMTRTQLHGLRMPAQSLMEWTQVFGYFAGDAQRIHDPNYAEACAYVDGKLKAQLSAAELSRLDERFRKQADVKGKRVLITASGWGALEIRRMEKMGAQANIPAALEFPAATLGAEQQKYLDLMDRGVFPEPDPADLPGEWMVQDEWQKMLESSPSRHWFSLLHLGVMRMEHFDLQGAVAAWQESMRLQPSAWAARNLAVAALRQGQHETALAYYRQAWELAKQKGRPNTALAVECLQALVKARQFEEGMVLYQALPVEIQQFDRIQILLGRISLVLGQLDVVENVLRREYAVVQEGENELTDLWTEMWMRREAAKTGEALNDALRQRILEKYPPPSNIDFRMIAKK